MNTTEKNQLHHDIPLSVLIGAGLQDPRYSDTMQRILSQSIDALMKRLDQLMSSGMGVEDALSQIRIEGNENGLTDDFGDTMVDAFLSAASKMIQRMHEND